MKFKKGGIAECITTRHSECGSVITKGEFYRVAKEDHETLVIRRAGQPEYWSIKDFKPVIIQK